MSTFTEEQIRYIVREELCKILDKGLMYSAETKPKPQQKEEPQTLAVDLETLEWTEVQGKKQPWQKSTTKNTAYYEAKKLIDHKHGFPVVIGDFTVWMCDDGSLGRRKK